MTELWEVWEDGPEDGSHTIFATKALAEEYAELLRPATYHGVHVLPVEPVVNYEITDEMREQLVADAKSIVERREWWSKRPPGGPARAIIRNLRDQDLL